MQEAEQMKYSFLSYLVASMEVDGGERVAVGG